MTTKLTIDWSRKGLARRVQLALALAAGAALLALAAGCAGGKQDTSQQSQPDQTPPPQEPAPEAKKAEAPLESAPEAKKAEAPPARTEHRASAEPRAHAEKPDDSTPKPPADSTPKPPAEPPVRMVTVPEGKKMRTALAIALSSKTSKIGDAFEATVNRDVRLPELDLVAIPIGSVVHGEVIDVRPAKAMKGQAMLSVKINGVKLPTGKQIPIVASLVTEGKDTTKRSVGGIAGGAAAGAILGRIIGKDTKGAAIGAVAGAAIGTGVVLGMDNKDITLPEGTELTFHFDESVQVPAPQTRL